MLTNTRTTRIEWGDCDPAGIIYYPRYFAIFDASTTHLVERATGMKKIDYLKAYDFVGHPVLETRAQFRVPTRFGDEVTIVSSIVACGRSSFKIEHRLTLDGTLAAEGSETRVWVGRSPDDPRQIKSKPIPPNVVALLTQGRGNDRVFPDGTKVR
ncbi:MAG: thioesterase family protein [Xanthobacteraceae bacterium]|jgi:4-hydroxybenzoyl-CoA thioesterase